MIHTLCRTVLLVLLTTLITASADEPLFPQTPGVVSYTYRNEFEKDFEGTLDTIVSLGITDMEFSNLFGKTAQEIRAMLDARGMKCSSFGVSYGDLRTHTNEVAANAKTLGASFVRVAWIPDRQPFTLELAEQTTREFNEIGRRLKKEFGLMFCYHNHGYEFQPYGDGTMFDVLMAQTNPQDVFIELDILWVHFPGADPVELVKKYGHRIKLMHLKDLKKGVVGDFSGKTSPENDVALGDGQIDVPGILAAARKGGVEHYYIEDESSQIAVQVPRSMAYLKSLRMTSDGQAMAAPVAVVTEPTNAAESDAIERKAAEEAAKKAAAEKILSEQHSELMKTMTPQRQAWEQTLRENLGSYYLPIHQREILAGKSNAWDFVQDDPSLPRVLLIGDSVSRAYTQGVRKALAGKANVHRAPANCGPTGRGLQKLDVWLGDGKWDLIHFNFGIHDRNTPVDQYSERLHEIVDRLEQTGAKLVWATTTPIPDDSETNQTAASIVEKNEIAAAMMEEHGIEMNDLFTVITPHLAEMQIAGDVHFKPIGYQFLAERVATVIEALLK